MSEPHDNRPFADPDLALLTDYTVADLLRIDVPTLRAGGGMTCITLYHCDNCKSWIALEPWYGDTGSTCRRCGIETPYERAG